MTDEFKKALFWFIAGALSEIIAFLLADGAGLIPT